jgi:hypothetical protein
MLRTYFQNLRIIKEASSLFLLSIYAAVTAAAKFVAKILTSALVEHWRMQ